MLDATTLKSKRAAAGIPGKLLCNKCGIARSRLSDIERGYITAAREELERIDAALDALIRAKFVIERTAEALGWPVGEVR